MINPSVLARAAEIRANFAAAQPFPHALIEDFLERPAADALLRDFPAFDRSRAITELGEVGRKATRESVSSISPRYAAFYRYVNSAAFLEAMSALTGIPKLLADQTLLGGGTHENLDGQGLHPHIDFNIDERRLLHRRLNLLIYLNPEWDDAWGGSIELHSDPRSAANQVKRFTPLFNRALIFETSERSWHGFPTIRLPQERKHLSRKSFSIYLYTRERPADEVAPAHTTFYVPPPAPRFAAGHTLSARDASELGEAIDSRDRLLALYHGLLVEKERRFNAVVSPGAGQAHLFLRYVKYTAGGWLRRLAARRRP